jgi:predicted lactoylglutathione lyase
MLLTGDKFRRFTLKQIADAKTSSEVMRALSANRAAQLTDFEEPEAA